MTFTMNDEGKALTDALKLLDAEIGAPLPKVVTSWISPTRIARRSSTAERPTGTRVRRLTRPIGVVEDARLAWRRATEAHAEARNMHESGSALLLVPKIYPWDATPLSRCSYTSRANRPRGRGYPASMRPRSDRSGPRIA